MVFYFSCFFFFKQKTAYEMRISDWSSDVCSSDLAEVEEVEEVEENENEYESVTNVDSGLQSIAVSQPAATSPDSVNDVPISAPANAAPNAAPAAAPVTETRGTRSEEHTSELQSLLRISYAVFCLKNKIINQSINPS